MIKLNNCKKCGKPKDRDGYYCKSCLDKKNAYNRECRRFFRENGLCSICGKVRVGKDEVNCPECRAKRAKNRKPTTTESYRKGQKYKKIVCYTRKANGICTYCGKRKAVEGKSRCLICLEKISYKRKVKTANL